MRNGECGGVADWLVEVTEDIGELLTEILGLNVDFVIGETQRLGGRLGVGLFAAFAVENGGKSLEWSF